VAVVERDRRPQLAARLGDEDRALGRATRVQLGQYGERVSVSGEGVADAHVVAGGDGLDRPGQLLEDGGDGSHAM
jgi:hypothetical protein